MSSSLQKQEVERHWLIYCHSYKDSNQYAKSPTFFKEETIFFIDLLFLRI